MSSEVKHSSPVRVLSTNGNPAEKWLLSPLGDIASFLPSSDLTFSPFQSPSKLRLRLPGDAASRESCESSSLAALHVSPGMFSPSKADATRALRAARRAQEQEQVRSVLVGASSSSSSSSSSSGGGIGKQALYAELTHNSLPFPAMSELEGGHEDHLLLSGVGGVGKESRGAAFGGFRSSSVLAGSHSGVAHTRSSSRGASYRGAQAGQFTPSVGAGRPSPPSRGRGSASPADGAPSRCNCKKSKCLKLYCECFASLRYCAGCNCHDCNNTKAHETAREGAIKATRERNSSAFVTKVNSNRGHATGCHCKNSLCLKKYCECFQAGAYCASNCKCLSCQNFSGSASLGVIKGLGDLRGGDKKRKGSPTSVAAVGDVYSPPLEGAPTGVMMHSHSRLSPRNATGSSSSGVGADVDDGLGMNMNLPLSLLPLEEGGDHDALLAPGDSAFSAALDADEQEASAAGTNAANKRPRGPASEHGADAVWKVVYPFFGANAPPTSKRVAMGVLDMLSDKDLYSLSQASSYWARAAMDESIWAWD